MSIYWKQSLWLGGVYWIVSLVLSLVDTFETYIADLILSFLLTVFLIPMNFLKPIKVIDKVIQKLPVTATFLVCVGWAPYVSILIFLLASLYATIVLLFGIMNVEGLILSLITPMSVVVVVKTACIIFSFIFASFFVFVSKKTVAGCLDKNFKLTDSDVCNMPVVEEAVAAHAKKMYKCKAANNTKNDTSKKEIVKETAKETVKEAVKKTVKKTVKEKKKVSNPVKKVASKKKVIAS